MASAWPISSCRCPSPGSPRPLTTMTPSTACRAWKCASSSSVIPSTSPMCSMTCRCVSKPGTRWRLSALRVAARPPCSTSCSAFWPPAAAACCSTVLPSIAITWSGCDGSAPRCCRMMCCLPARLPTTSVFSAPRPTRAGSSSARAWRRCMTTSRRCPWPTTPWWATWARCCRVGRSNASCWPGRCTGGPSFCFSTRPPATSTSPGRRRSIMPCKR
ncbi:hypothetical protein D9M71_600960 [compost metagenome]